MTQVGPILPRFSVSQASEEQPTGRLLILLFRAFEDRLIRELNRRGIEELSVADLSILRHIDPRGAQVTEIARLAGVSKQAASKMILELERRGVLRLGEDPMDGRARRVSFTPRGKKLIASCIEVIREIEDEYREVLGKGRYLEFRKVLLELIRFS